MYLKNYYYFPLNCYICICLRYVKISIREFYRVSNCTPIKSSKTKISAEFIVVECSIKNKGSNEPPKYRMWHGIATTSNIERKHLIKRKLEFWKKHKTETNYRPPNILIIGHDSTSRLNFRRQMPKTLTVLENLGAVEMLGYMRGVHSF